MNRSRSSSILKDQLITSIGNDFDPIKKKHWKHSLYPINESLEQLPKTNSSRIVYVFDFRKKIYRLFNPNRFIFPSRFPTKALNKVGIPLSNNLKLNQRIKHRFPNMPEAEHRGRFLIMLISFLILMMMVLSVYFYDKISQTRE